MRASKFFIRTIEATYAIVARRGKAQRKYSTDLFCMLLTKLNCSSGELPLKKTHFDFLKYALSS